MNRTCPSCMKPISILKIIGINRFSRIKCSGCEVEYHRKLDVQFFVSLFLLFLAFKGISLLKWSLGENFMASLAAMVLISVVDAFSVKLVPIPRSS